MFRTFMLLMSNKLQRKDSWFTLSLFKHNQPQHNSSNLYSETISSDKQNQRTITVPTVKYANVINILQYFVFFCEN